MRQGLELARQRRRVEAAKIIGEKKDNSKMLARSSLRWCGVGGEVLL